MKNRDFIRTSRNFQGTFFSLQGVHNVYESLSTETKKGQWISQKLASVLTQVWALFDPFGLVKSFGAVNGRYTTKAFDTIFALYEIYVQTLMEAERDN